MKRLLLIALFVGFVPHATSVSAQVIKDYPLSAFGPTEYLQFVGGSSTRAYGYQVGPYVGHFQGDPASAQFSIFCVDFNHYAKSQNVNVTSVVGGTLGNTRLGDGETYKQLAYLASMFEDAPTTEWGKLHAAIWKIASGVNVGDTGGYENTVVPMSFSARGWYVLSPTTIIPGGGRGDGTGQEFLMRVSVPEPATFLLMATGLLLLAAFSRKRLVEIVRQDA